LKNIWSLAANGDGRKKYCFQKFNNIIEVENMKKLINLALVLVGAFAIYAIWFMEGNKIVFPCCIVLMVVLAFLKDKKNPKTETSKQE